MPGQIFDRGRDPFPFKNLDWFRPSVDPGISFFKIGSNRPSVDPSFPFLKFGLNQWSVNPCVILLKLDRFVRLWVLASPFRSFYLIGRPWTPLKIQTDLVVRGSLPYFYFLHYRFESFCMTHTLGRHHDHLIFNMVTFKLRDSQYRDRMTHSE